VSFLSGKNIIRGISGGIAAYKTALLVRLLIKAGATVKVIMTPASKDFVTPLTLSTLSKNPVYSSFYNNEEENEMWNNHVEFALWADIMIVAPTTANTLAKMANGICDNLLVATYLSAKCPVYIAPAMDLDMYVHHSTIENISKLQLSGNSIIPAESGELASGLSGEGRMAEPENIISFIENDILFKLPLKGKKVLITAGPTYEAIDPVRFIGNYSTGKMGFDLAKSAANLGAEVTLVTGPTSLKISNHLVTVIPVVTAQQMLHTCLRYYDDTDVAIAAAAVADYRPKTVAKHKIKKKDSIVSIELEPTEDILAILGTKKTKQYLIGFALETENEIENAQHKIRKKNLDFIVLNSLRDEGAGFGTATNKVTFIDKNFTIEPKELKLKEAVALDIMLKVVTHFQS
jgi:phosphopantothenoylcysteine decarboxylase/phosphopantothenate--cysteine ligase